MKKMTYWTATAAVVTTLSACSMFGPPPVPAWDKNGFDLPIVDLNDRTDMQVIVDKEKGQYLGHPTTHLCEDGKTIVCVYPKGHGRGPIVLKKSYDGGKTWSERLPTPESWKTSKEVPTLYPTVGPEGQKYVLMFSGIQYSDKNSRNRMAFSKDDGKTWSELQNIPNQEGGIVVMGDLVALNTGKGHYMATYHNNCRGKDEKGNYGSLELYTVKTTDGGMTWSDPEIIFPGKRDMHLCEGGFVRSPDGKTIAILLRENSKKNNSQIMFSTDGGKTWTAPKPMPGVLCGDRHQAVYLPDGRLLIQFRDITPWHKAGVTKSPTEGDWVGWVGTWDDLANGYEGEYRIRFKDNRNGGDTAYPAAEILPDGTVVCTTYGHFNRNESPYILCERFKMDELDRLADAAREEQPKIINDMGGKEVRVFDPMNPDAINKAIEKK